MGHCGECGLRQSIDGLIGNPEQWIVENGVARDRGGRVDRKDEGGQRHAARSGGLSEDGQNKGDT